MLVYLWAFALTIITIVYLFVCVDSNKGGILAKIKILIFYAAPDFIREA